jgi:hypothetical protein
MGRAFAADQTRGEGADAELIESIGGVGLHSRVRSKAEIIVIGETDEMVAAALGFCAKAIYRGEERISEVEDRFPRQSKAL